MTILQLDAAVALFGAATFAAGFLFGRSNSKSRLLAACEAAEHWLAEELVNPGTKPDEILRVIRGAIADAKGGAT